jgi:hypothetical protein
LLTPFEDATLDVRLRDGGSRPDSVASDEALLNNDRILPFAAADSGEYMVRVGTLGVAADF